MEKDFYEKLLAGQLVVASKVLNESKSYLSDTFESFASICDLEHDLVAVTPSGIKKDQLDSSQIVIYKLSTGELIHGKRDVGEEVNFHISLYKKFPQMHSIFRVYSENSLALSNSTVVTKQFVEKGNDDTTDFWNGEFTYLSSILNGIEVTTKGFIVLPKKGVLIWNDNAFRLTMDIDKIENFCKVLYSDAVIDSDSYLNTYLSILKQYGVEATTISKPCGGCTVTPDEQQIVNFELLCYFDKICRQNNIKYSLTGGTLLGAIRQGGFIPWDDDADVFLARPEYEKLVAAFPDDNRFILLNSKKDTTFPYVYSRLIDTKSLITLSPNTLSAGRGLFLDVCVVDGLPKNKLRRLFHIRKMRLFFSCRRATIHSKDSPAYKKRGVFYKLAWNLILIFTRTQAWNRRINRNISKFPFDKSEYVGNFTSQYGIKEMLHRSCFDDYIDVPFENHNFMICAGYEEYLKNIYKDYFALPKKDKRKGHHENNCIWVN